MYKALSLIPSTGKKRKKKRKKQKESKGNWMEV
jgi:hypothetical protein